MIGESLNTPWKEVGFQTVVAAIIKNTNSAIDRFGGRASLHVMDCYAGTGINSYGAGSVAVIDNVMHCDIDGCGKREINLIACEIDKENYAELVKNTAHIKVKTHNTDCSNIIEKLSTIIEDEFFEDPVYAVGFVLLDPNGLIDERCRESLAKLSVECPNIDIILNINVSALKRCKGVRKYSSFSKFSNWEINKLQQLIDKKNCYVRTFGKSRTSWTIAVFTNQYLSRDIKEAGFYNIKTPIGEMARRKVDRDKPIQMELF